MFVSWISYVYDILKYLSKSQNLYENRNQAILAFILNSEGYMWDSKLRRQARRWRRGRVPAGSGAPGPGDTARLAPRRRFSAQFRDMPF